MAGDLKRTTEEKRDFENKFIASHNEKEEELKRSITFSEIFNQPQSKNSNPKISRTNMADSNVIIDAIDNPQIFKDEEIQKNSSGKIIY